MSSNKHMAFRTGTINDLDQLQELRVKAYRQFQNILTPDNWAVFSGNLSNKERLRDLLNISTCFVCAEGDKLVGAAYLVASGHPNEHFKTEWAQVRMVGVDPAYRGQGIARQLTNLCIEHAKNTNEKTIALHTSEFMDAARHIYESAGFKVYREIPQLFGKKYWVYTMHLG